MLAIAPQTAAPVAGESVLSDQAAAAIITERCVSCHSATPSDDVFKVAPGGVTLDTLEQVRQWAPRIKARSVDVTDMPFMNKTDMTAQERAQIAAWIASGATR